MFDSCDEPYEIGYLKTKEVTEEKKFKDVAVGDKLYCLDPSGIIFGGVLTELTVTKSWHVHRIIDWRGRSRAHCIISIDKELKGKKYIDFGWERSYNCSSESPEASLVFFESAVIGTSKKCVVDEVRSDLLGQIGTLKSQLNTLTNTLNSL